jgi:hypothetical protein
LEIQAHSAEKFATVDFLVADTGIGIPKDKQVLVFQAFEQLDTNQRNQGTGLGLAISYQLVEAFGSKLHLESEVGKGSRFSFSLQLAIPEMPSVSELSREIRAYRGARKVIAIADDNAENLDLLSKFFASLGFETILADDGLSLLKALEVQSCDMLLLDMNMPQLSGVEILHQLRQKASYQNLPVISMSADTFAENRAASLEAGSNAFMAKPLKLSELLELIGTYLALEWEYSETDAIAENSLSAPPKEVLDEFYELAKRGNLRALQDKTHEVEPTYSVFAQQIRTLAQQFDEEAIMTLLAKFMD